MRDLSLKETALAALHILLFAVAAVLIATFLLVWKLWGYVSLEQILFHFTVPLSGSFNSGLKIGIAVAVAGAAALTFAYAWFCLQAVRRSRSFATTAVLLGAFALAAVLAEWKSGATGFLLRQFQTTKLFDSVPPRSVKIGFPGQKRNLLVIHMESMEETFARPEVMGANLIPELERLKNENVSFSGFRQVRGTSWTTAGETASALGLPLLLPIGHNDYGNYESFLPGALSVFEVLEQNGYALEFMFPNDCSFGGIENLIRTHARHPVIKDLRWFSAHRPDSEEQRGNIWGLRDRYLYEQLRQELTLRAATGTPYAFFVETIDTHGPDTFYFLDPDTHAPRRFHDFRDVIRAGSLMLNEFLTWLSRQEFASDLTVVILGDHLWMGDEIAGRKLGESRAVYNVFINPLARVEKSGERLFCAPDFAPTILEAAGARLPNRRFGIGTSLFSSQPTVMERLGEEKFAEELGKTSRRYNRFFQRPRGYRASRARSGTINDFSAGAPTLSFLDDDVFLRRAPYGTVQFALFNSSPTTLSGRGKNALSLKVEVCGPDGTPLPECSVSTELPRDMPPQDAELIQARLPLPSPGDYTLRVSFVGKNTTALKSVSAPLTIARHWLFEGENAGGEGARADERTVLDAGTPCLVFPERMEVWHHGGTLYFKLLDRDLEADEIILRGTGARATPRLLRNACGQTYRWAAAPLGNLSPERIETGFSSNDETQRVSFSLKTEIPARVLREENDLRRYVQAARDRGVLILAAANEKDKGAFLAAVKGNSLLTTQTSPKGPLHYETLVDGACVGMNAYADPADAPSPMYDRLSLRVDGLEYAVSQRGLNLAVYDFATHRVVDRVMFPYHGSLDGLTELLCGRESDFAAASGTHRSAPGTAPVERGAYIASWKDGPYVTKYDGRLYFQTPWEFVFSTQLLAAPLTRPFAPLERAVSISPAGVLSCVPVGKAPSCEVGFVAPDGQQRSVAVNLTPLYLETNLDTYLHRLADPDLITFISVYEEGALTLTSQHKRLFADLGLDTLLKDTRGHAYVAISDGGRKVLEALDARRVEEVLSVGGLGVRLVSVGGSDKPRSSILLDGEEYSVQSQGMNIVVYSKKHKRVIDSVCFNTCAGLAATRKDPRFKRL